MPREPLKQLVADGANWMPGEILREKSWQHTLAPIEIKSLVDMASKLQPQLKRDPSNLLAMDSSSFNLGLLEDLPKRIYKELKQGTGLFLLRGLPVQELEPIVVASIYWAIGKHLGEAMPNNPDGDMLGHVTDLGKSQADANSRGYQTREAMDYHCDQCDIVGLLCIRQAQSGGVSKIASSISMYNTLLELYPEYAQALSGPLYWSKHGEHASGEEPYYSSPVFNFLDNKLCTSFGPKHIVKGHQLPGTPALTEVQRAALQKAEEIAEQQHVSMVLQAGDIQFLNNYVVLHTRTEYIDHDDPVHKRLMWRLWLMNDDLRPRTGYTKQWHSGVQLGMDKARIIL